MSLSPPRHSLSHARVHAHTHTHTTHRDFKLLAFYILNHISNLGLLFTCDFSVIM